MQRALIIGGAGFIGANLTGYLLGAGIRVRCFDRPHVKHLYAPAVRDGLFEIVEGDFACEADVATALDGVDVCFHLASTTLPKSSNADPAFDVETNLVGTLRLLDLAVRIGVERVVFVSSGGTVYGLPECTPISEEHPTNPQCSYGITKLAIEKYLALYHRVHGLDYAVLRVSNPYGVLQRTHSSQGAVAVFLGKVLRGEAVEVWGDGSIVRDYIYIEDVVSALWAAATRHFGLDRVFNIGSGEGRSINDVLDAIERVTGRAVHRQYMESRMCDVPVNVLSIVKAMHALDWCPRVRFDDGLRRFAEWLVLNPEYM